MSNEPCKTTKMRRNDINQDHLAKEDQQRTDDCALTMMQAMHEHEEHQDTQIEAQN